MTNGPSSKHRAKRCPTLYRGINYHGWNEMPLWVAGFVVKDRDMVCGGGLHGGRRSRGAWGRALGG
jgi:hypothetical protein